jgi:hypothetical protein
MTAHELARKLLDGPDLPVFYADAENGNLDVADVSIEPDAKTTVTYKTHMVPTLAYSNGQEITVDVPKQLPVYTHEPGVVLS